MRVGCLKGVGCWVPQTVHRQATALGELLSQCGSPVEARYVVRCVEGSMRLGAGWRTVVMALCCAALPTPEQEDQRRRLYQARRVLLPRIAISTTTTGCAGNRIALLPRCTGTACTVGAAAVWEATNKHGVFLPLCLLATQTLLDRYGATDPNWEGMLQEVSSLEGGEGSHSPEKVAPSNGWAAGIPLAPMLAVPATSVHQAWKRMRLPWGDQDATTSPTSVSCDDKYDGVRALVHVSQGLDGGTGNTRNETPSPCYSILLQARSMRSLTERFPEVVTGLQQQVSQLQNPRITSMVLDAELVAVDSQSQTILPFQTLSTRVQRKVGMPPVLFSFIVFPVGCKNLRECWYSRRGPKCLSVGTEGGCFEY